MKPRRRHGGLLSGMVKYPREGHRKSKKPPSMARRFGTWVVGGVVIAALAGVLGAIFWGLFHPEAGRPGAGEFTVEEVRPDPPGFTPEQHVTAAAYIRISGRRVAIPLTADSPPGVERGSTLHVEYTFLPKYGRYDVRSWTLVPGAPRPPGGPPAPAGS